MRGETLPQGGRAAPPTLPGGGGGEKYMEKQVCIIVKKIAWSGGGGEVFSEFIPMKISKFCTCNFQFLLTKRSFGVSL